MPMGATKRARKRQARYQVPELPSSSDVELRHITQPAKTTISRPPNGKKILLVR